jgi:ABC-type nickel/cobalt efflux system permease component RcnA
MNKLLTLIIVVFLLLIPFQIEAGDNPFISKKIPKKEVKLPTIASRALSKIMLWQRQLNTKLTEQVKQLKTEKSWDTILPLILISFLYGVIHAAGPGHGKVVVFSYFMSRRSNIKKGILLGNLISLFHAASGVLIVLTLYFIIKSAYLASFEAISQKIKLVSYSLVILIGLALLLNSIFNITKRLSQKSEKEIPAKSFDHKGVLPLALAVGMVPCPGVVIIMLFTLSFNLPVTGIILSLIMALGMATTISFAGLLSILGQEGLLKSFPRTKKAQYLVQKSLTLFGSLLIIGFGGVLLAGVV